jgi:uncharacterized protein (DUF1778 family)
MATTTTTKTTATTTSARLTARVPEGVHAMIEEAAALCGSTVNQFLVQAAKERAQEVLDEERLVRLSRRDAKVFLAALENPPPVNEAMKRAARRHAEAVGRAEV